MTIRKLFCVVLSLIMLLSICTSATAMTAGAYEGIGTGRNGNVKVSVTVTDNAITKVIVTEHMESPGISDPAIERIPAAIVEHQSLNIDVVSVATLTCAAVLEGSEKALAAAGADIEALKNKVIEVEAGDPIDKTADVIVIGGGAGLSASVAAAEAGASVIMIETMDVLGGNTIISSGKWNAADPDIQGRTETVSGQIDTLKTYLDKNPEDYFGKALLSKQTGMMPVASPTKCCKSRYFAPEADALRKDLHNKLHAQKCTTKNEKKARRGTRSGIMKPYGTRPSLFAAKSAKNKLV